MIFDPVRRVYVRPDGSVVSPNELRQMIESYIEDEKQEVGREAQKLIAGTITAAFFFDWLRGKIKEVHGAAGLTAYGGEMNRERWSRIGQKVTSEIAFANQFEKDFQASEKAAQAIISEVVEVLNAPEATVERVVRTVAPSTIPAELSAQAEVSQEALERIATSERISQLIYGQTPNRASLYMESVYGTHENSVRDRESDAGVISGRRVTESDTSVCDGCEAAATEEFIPLNEILDIGAAECMANCRCTIEFDYYGVGPLAIPKDIYAPGFQNVNALTVL